MKRSLQRHLSMTLGGTIVLAGLVAALASFSLAYYEARGSFRTTYYGRLPCSMSAIPANFHR